MAARPPFHGNSLCKGMLEAEDTLGQCSASYSQTPPPFLWFPPEISLPSLQWASGDMPLPDLAFLQPSSLCLEMPQGMADPRGAVPGFLGDFWSRVSPLTYIRRMSLYHSKPLLGVPSYSINLP